MLYSDFLNRMYTLDGANLGSAALYEEVKLGFSLWGWIARVKKTLLCWLGVFQVQSFRKSQPKFTFKEKMIASWI